VRDFVLVLIHKGIGTGIVFDGQIYRGKGGIAGEFGHMTIGKDAPIIARRAKIIAGKLLRPSVLPSRAMPNCWRNKTAPGK
jgi:hypothetical protein